MVHTVETKISSPSTVIEIVTDVQPEKNVEYFNCSRELEKGGCEYKESSSTQTSSSSSLLHKRKVHSYYDPNRFHKSSNNCKPLMNLPKKNTSTISQRIISAKCLRVKQLQNELIEAQKKIIDLQEENRTLKNIHKRQDSALRKYESQDSYLPQLLRSHEEETRVITLKYKKLRTVHADLESRYNKQFSEFTFMKDRYKHLLIISRDKHLLQREQLTKQIEEMKIIINDLKNRIKLQSRRLDLEAKNHKHQLSIEFNKQKSLQDQLRHSEENIRKLQSALKDKEKCMANFKINQHISNKINQMKLKLPSNSLKPVTRKCSDHEDDVFKSITTSNTKKENTINENCSKEIMNTIKKYDTEITRKIFSEQNNIEESFDYKRNEPVLESCSKRESNLLETKSEFDIFAHSYNDKVRSDNNNNIKQNLQESDVFDNQKSKVIFNSVDVENYSFENFDSYEKCSQDESSSEKSDDFKPTDETVSWLELHEKIQQENAEIDQKWDQFCDSFTSQKSSLISQNQNISQDESNSNSEKADGKTLNSRSNYFWDSETINITGPAADKTDSNPKKNHLETTSKDSRNKILSPDKKTSLLSALKEIDLAKNNSNASCLNSHNECTVERKIKKNTNH